jgi:hypothetical protein
MCRICRFLSHIILCGYVACNHDMSNIAALFVEESGRIR